MKGMEHHSINSIINCRIFHLVSGRVLISGIRVSKSAKSAINPLIRVYDALIS